MTMTNYDNWLERPYQDMYDEMDRFIAWCEDNEIDCDDPLAEERYEAFMEDEAERYAEYMMDRYEDDYDDWDDRYDCF